MLNEDYADEAFITSPPSAVSDSPKTPHALEELQDGGDSLPMPTLRILYKISKIQVGVLKNLQKQGKTGASQAPSEKGSSKPFLVLISVNILICFVILQ